MVQAPAKIKKDAIWYLDKDRKYFLREFTYIGPLLKEAYDIARNVHNFRLEEHNRNELKLMISQLKKLENRQRWQQIRSRYSKLRKAMTKLLMLPTLNVDTKNRIVNLMRKEHIFENDSLHRTAEEIEPSIRRKKLHEINWGEVVDKIAKLKIDIQDLAYIAGELKKAVEKA